MNTKELRVEMIRYGDTMQDLAEYLGCTRVTAHRKVHGELQFKQNEIIKIKQRYKLSDERLIEIFYGEGVTV